MFELKNVKGDAAELFFGPSAAASKREQWIQTIPRRGWFTYLADLWTGATCLRWDMETGGFPADRLSVHGWQQPYVDVE
jgi:hypothetical protein